ncbi:MAG: hypothetical protein JWP29_2425 [Rhodoferax sp.]|nr:hypothetical protein [Rhodoferax sp.]
MSRTPISSKARGLLVADGSTGLDWPKLLVIAAMLLLAAIGYWSDNRFEGLSQGLEWAQDTGDADTPG